MSLRSILALLAAVILVALGVILFRGGSDKPTLPKEPTKTLPDYATTEASVRFTYDGIINGENSHRAIRITVNSSQRVLEVLQGYGANVIQSAPEPNTEVAYNVFLNALNNVGFTKVRKTKNTNVDGACPLGNRFLYELIDTGDSAADFLTWSTTCGSTGTFGGSRTNTQTLFQRQITNYDSKVSKVAINGR